MMICDTAGPEPFWPPRVPDNVETIAASYVQHGAGGKVRLFNLVSKTRNFVSKTRDCVLKTRSFVFKMMDFAEP